MGYNARKPFGRTSRARSRLDPRRRRHLSRFPPRLDHRPFEGARNEEEGAASTPGRGGTALLVAEPKLAPTAETDMEFYRRKATPIVVRHVSGDRVVAMIEVVSPGNKATRNALRSFTEKAAELLDRRIHLLVVDLLPPGKRDPQGIHAAIWEDIAGEESTLPAGKPLTLAAYETALTVRAYVRHVAAGDPLPDMPLFLEPNGCVQAPLEATYQSAFAAMPQRWRRVLEAPAG
jgi:hypothetical protein